MTPPNTPATQPPPETGAAPDFGGLAGDAGVGRIVGLGGYLDNPVPVSNVKLRFDAAFGVNRPDRSEFFWAAWSELGDHPHGILNNAGTAIKGAYYDPNAKGPDYLFKNLNYQELAPYLEFAFTRRLSAFVDLPSRFLQTKGLLEDPDTTVPKNPANYVTLANGRKLPVYPEGNTPNENANLPLNGFQKSGFSDMNAGFKYAMIADPDRFVTFQFRTYIPTGDPSMGLGTGHVSLEPGLLFYQRMSDRWVVQGQLRDWIPVGGSRSTNDPGFTIGGGVSSDTGKRFDGNILIYGVGAGYDIIQRGNFRVTPFTELVGWTVFNGLESIAAGPFGGTPADVDLPNNHGVHDVSGTTIINAKFGVRTSFGNGQSLYVGYGHALTGAVWYKDIFSIEYRFLF